MNQSAAKSRIIAVVLLAGLLPLLVSLAAHLYFGDERRVHEPIHGFTEVAGTCIALAVAMLLLLRARHEEASPHLLWVAAGLVVMGIVDGVHAMTPFGAAFSWTRHGATLVGGLLFGLVWLPLPALAVRRARRFIVIMAAAAMVGALATWRYADLLPASWVPGGYSLAVKAANTLGGLGFLAAALFFSRRYLHQPVTEDLVFASHTLLFGTAGVMFGFSHVWAADWWVWHGFRLLAYAVVLVAGHETVVVLYQRIAQHAQRLADSEQRLSKETAAVATIMREMLSGEATHAETEKQVLDACLDATQGKYGMVGVVNQHGKYDTTTYSSRTMSDCAFPEALAWELTTGMEIRGIWGWCMIHGKPLLCNNLAEHRDRVGAPKGHVPIECFLGVPVKRDGKVTGMVAVANKPGGFTEADVETLTRLVDVMTASQRHRELLDEQKRLVGERSAQLEEIKRAEEALQRMVEDLNRSNKELEQFAYVASHDLQEPLRMVSSFTQLLERRYGDKLDQSAKEFIHFAVDGAQRMQRLINDLLAYSRVQTKGKPLSPTDSLEALNVAQENLSMAIMESRAAVSHGNLPVVQADGTQLAQLFQNLIGNAIKFHGADLPHIHVSAEPKGEEWVFSVRDNGIGIAPEYFERIFVIFQRLHAGGTYPGTGIGLAICKKIVERHGGRIWVESQPGKGSTFYFTLRH